MNSFAMQVPTFRALRKDNIYFRTIEEREKIKNEIFVSRNDDDLVQMTFS